MPQECCVKPLPPTLVRFTAQAHKGRGRIFSDLVVVLRSHNSIGAALEFQPGRVLPSVRKHRIVYPPTAPQWPIRRGWAATAVRNPD